MEPQEPEESEEEEPLRGFWAEVGRTVRYAIASSARTARLSLLMVSAIGLAHYLH